MKQANDYFRRALQSDPRFVPSLKNLGINEYNLHDLTESGKHLELAFQRSPDDPVINLYVGEVAYAQQNFKRSSELLPHAQQFVSRDPDLKSHLAISLLQTGKKSAALVLLDTFDPGSLSATSQFSIGLSLAQSDLPVRAIPYLELLRQHFPDSYNAAYNLVICYIGAKKFPDAISLANQLVTQSHKGWTVAIALIGTVVGSFSAGVVGQKLGGRETLRITAILYVISALGSALAWNWPSLMIFRFIGGLGIGASSVLGPVYIADLAPAKWRERLSGCISVQRGVRDSAGVHLKLSHPHASPARDGMALAGWHCRGSAGWIFDSAV